VADPGRSGVGQPRPGPDRRGLEEELWARFSRPLRLFAARRLGDFTAAEDVAQSVLRRVLESLRAERIRDLDALAGFVYQTARHVCLHWLRSAGRERRALARVAGGGSSLGGEPDALSALVAAERLAAVRSALEELDGSDRELLRMVYFELLGSAEIARRLGVSAGALRVRKHRALRRLEDRLARGASGGGNSRPPSGTRS
jgi:RNA polymerase sigma-70 factor, ECF subfamily